jgi:MOSC domain-containing protein YiiM
VRVATPLRGPPPRYREPIKEVASAAERGPVEWSSFAACLATILELSLEGVPRPADDEDPALGRTTSRWLAGLGLGIVPIADAGSFSWPGPWIARVASPRASERRCVVMFGVPSGVVWDPAAGHRPAEAADPVLPEWIEDGFLIAATDIALARPAPATRPAGTGTVEGIFVAAAASEPTQSLERVRALAGKGLEGDRHLSGTGTFPSGLPGSALTLIEAEVCESLAPVLGPDEHRRNVVTRGIDLNGLVGLEFRIGALRCRGMRLCEPCTVAQRYASRPILRSLVHRGGLRADILQDGEIVRGDLVQVGGD